jgi:hypothetical protein
MSWGFTATNANGQVLVSSNTQNLHFYGKAIYSQSIVSSANFGGMYRWLYVTDCLDYPTPFLTPNNGFMGVTSIRLSGATWQIEIISSNPNLPEVYIFTPARSIAATGDYGLVVYKDASKVSFDSRLKPLSIYGGAMLSPPNNPRTGAISGSAWECRSAPNNTLSPDNWNTSYISTSNVNYVKLIYHYPSMAQSEREQEFSTGRWSEGGCADKREYELWSTYWCFYRAGIRPEWTGGGVVKINCGWIPVDGGCHSRRYESGRSIIGIPVGGGGTSSGGAWPYSNETLNTAPTFMLISNGDLYD